MRLEQAKIDWQGRARALDKKLLEIPIQGPATLECGFFVPAPWTKVGRNSSWELSDPGSPGTPGGGRAGIGGGVTCIKIAGLMQSEDWDHGGATKPPGGAAIRFGFIRSS